MGRTKQKQIEGELIYDTQVVERWEKMQVWRS